MKKNKTVKVSRNEDYKNIRRQKEKQQRERAQLRKELIALSRRRKVISKLPKSVQQTIPYISDYENGVLELEKTKAGNRYSICITFEDMNYSTLKIEDAKTIYRRYTDLLNAIPTEVDAAIIINNQNVDMEKLKKQIYTHSRGDRLDYLRHEMNDIMEHNILKGNNHLTKDRYITITLEAANPIEAFTKFERLETEIMNALKYIGTVGRRLSTMERFEQIYDIYNPEKIGEFNRLEMKYNEVKKQGIHLKDYVCPEGFSFQENRMKIGNKFARYIIINGFPRTMSDRFLGDLSDMLFNVIITIQIHPVKMTEGIKLINKQILGMESNKQESQKHAIRSGYTPDMINHNLKDALEDALELRDDIKNQNQKLFEVTFNLLIFADTMEELENNTESMQAVAGKYLCQLMTPHYLQEEGLNQTLPFGHVDKIDRKRTLTSESTAIFIPFISQELMHKNGFYYGLNAISNKMIYFDRLSLHNANGFILGSSGSGKSFSAKREMANILLNTNDEVIVIDPDGEYTPFAEGLGGERIAISPLSNTYINPMDMNKDYSLEEVAPIIGKSDFIISVIETAISDGEAGITAVQRAIIDRCVRQVYAPYISGGYRKEAVPTFKDLQKVLRQQKDSHDAREIADAFELFAEGSLSVFANKTNVNMSSRFIIYDISELGKNLNAIGSLIMLDAVWNHILENRKKGVRTWLYVDEFTVLLRKASSKLFFLDTFKRIRKLGGACTGITQNITSLFRDEEAMEMLANSEFIYLLNQAASDRVPLAEILNMSKTQLEYVSDAKKGHGLIKAGRHIVPFKDRFPKDTELYRFMTTDPEERKSIDWASLNENADGGNQLWQE